MTACSSVAVRTSGFHARGLIRAIMRFPETPQGAALSPGKVEVSDSRPAWGWSALVIVCSDRCILFLNNYRNSMWWFVSSPFFRRRLGHSIGICGMRIVNKQRLFGLLHEGHGQQVQKSRHGFQNIAKFTANNTWRVPIHINFFIKRHADKTSHTELIGNHSYHL